MANQETAERVIIATIETVTARAALLPDLAQGVQNTTQRATYSM